MGMCSHFLHDVWLNRVINDPNSSYTCLTELIDVKIQNVSADSALIVLMCGMDNITVDYLLDNQRITLTCGESMNLTGLVPNTQYALIRSYSNLINCSFNFTTSDAESKSFWWLKTMTEFILIGINTTPVISHRRIKVYIGLSLTVILVTITVILIVVVVYIIIICNNRNHVYKVNHKVNLICDATDDNVSHLSICISVLFLLQDVASKNVQLIFLLSKNIQFIFLL